jgi:hypothetical protein
VHSEICPGKRTYQEDNGDVEKEGNRSVGKEVEAPNAVDVVHANARHLGEDENQKVHKSAARGIVIERNHRVHLEVLSAKEALYHNQTSSFEEDAANLEQEADQDELDFAERRDDNTENDNGNVSEGFEIGLLHAERQARDQDGDRSGCLRLCQSLSLRCVALFGDVPLTSG